MSLYNVDPIQTERFRLTVSEWSDRSVGPTVCRACGCRLEAGPSWFDNDTDHAGIWRHYRGAPGRDARGCTVDCVDLDHHVDGTPLV